MGSEMCIRDSKKTDPKTYRDGIVIGRVPIIRPSKNILSTHYNTLSKLNCILASIEANKLGFDEGIMDDPNGNVSTCNSTNLFFIKNKQVLNFCSNNFLKLYFSFMGTTSVLILIFNFKKGINLDFVIF